MVFIHKDHSSVFESPRTLGVSWSDLGSACIKNQVKGLTYPCMLCIGVHDRGWERVVGWGRFTVICLVPSGPTDLRSEVLRCCQAISKPISLHLTEEQTQFKGDPREDAKSN